MQQMTALSVVGANLIDSSMVPLTADTGGKSASDPNAGTSAPIFPHDEFPEITTADRAGAGILTVLVVFGMAGGAYWLVS
jgi:hypothetical protein